MVEYTKLILVDIESSVSQNNEQERITLISLKKDNGTIAYLPGNSEWKRRRKSCIKIWKIKKKWKRV